LSFFDETDEPARGPRTRKPTGSARRPPSDQQTIMVRRAVFLVAAVVVLILMVVGIHSCQVSATNSALKSYNTNVGMIVQQSDRTGANVFKALTGASNDPNVQQTLDAQKSAAQSELTQAQSLSVPDQMSTAQQNFLLTMKLRSTGVADIASNIQPALTKGTANQAINSIAADMQMFLASDVVYTTQTAQQIAAALHAAGISVGGSSGEQIQPTNFFPDLAWLSPTYIASQLGATLSSSSGGSGPSSCPSNCGHQLNSVSVGGVALSPGGGNTIPATPAPTFTANFNNSGQITQTNVTVEATVTTSSGTTIGPVKQTLPSTKPGQSYSTQLTLPRSPPTGQAQVTVKVLGVPGENDLNNNVLTFPVTFD
jgi:hypothetical protein